MQLSVPQSISAGRYFPSLDTKSYMVNRGKRFDESFRIGYEYREYASKKKNRLIMKEANRLQSCGTRLSYWKETRRGGRSTVKIRKYYCGHRACPACNKIKNTFMRKRLSQAVDEIGAENLIFATFTMPEVPVSEVRSQFDILTKEVSGLMRTKLMKLVCPGGFRSIEGNADSESMVNAHQHNILVMKKRDLTDEPEIIKFLGSDVYLSRQAVYLKNNPDKTLDQINKTNARFLKKGRLSQLMWSALMVGRGLGEIVYVKEVSSYKNPGESVGEELCKYLTKSMKLVGDSLPQYILSMKGKRAFSSWGIVKMNIDENKIIELSASEDEVVDPDDEVVSVEYIGNLKEVLHKALIENDSFCQMAIGVSIREKLIVVDNWEQ